MLPKDWESLLRGGMVSAGVAGLSAAKRRRVAAVVAGRLERHGVEPALHNWGGVLCGRAVHDGCCAVVGGRRLQRFEGDADGARRLVELSCHSTGAATVSGFRSELRTGGLFGPSEEAARTFQEIAAGWAGLEADFGVTKLRTSFVKDSYEAWIAFRDKWQSGDEDTTALSAMVAELNMTRRNLGKPPKEIHAPDVTQSTPVLKAFSKVDETARDATKAASQAASSVVANTWGAVPLSVKLGAAGVAAAVLTVLVATLRVMR